jgi:hypothetical protein
MIFVLAAAIGACAAAADLPPALRYKAVLIAGDSSAPAFDHATAAVRDRLLAAKAAPNDIQVLSADRGVVGRNGVLSSSLEHVLAAIARIHPAPGQGCLVFATSHGAFRRGLVLMPSENYLTPAALDAALSTGCGDAPTVVIISGCFSGTFARPPVARANRIIFTAAREDRPSFGCGTGFQYTFYDRCLLGAMDHTATWREAYAAIRSCVAAREKEQRSLPSEPQSYFGPTVEAMPIPRPPR